MAICRDTRACRESRRRSCRRHSFPWCWSFQGARGTGMMGAGSTRCPAWSGDRPEAAYHHTWRTSWQTPMPLPGNKKIMMKCCYVSDKQISPSYNTNFINWNVECLLHLQIVFDEHQLQKCLTSHKPDKS